MIELGSSKRRTIFKILREISPYPDEFLGLRALIILAISLVDVWSKIKLGKGFLKTLNR